MAPSTSDAPNGRLDPPIPSYDEAMSLPSPSNFDPLSPMGEAFYAPDSEHHALLHRSHRRSASTATDPSGAAAGGTRPRSRPSGYRPPTVETDDEEDSTWSSSDSDSGDGRHDDGDGDTEAAHVRREMQELEMEDPLSGDGPHGRGRSLFGKPIGFALPRWNWRWRWAMPRLRIQLPNGPGLAEGSSFRSRLGRFTRVSQTAEEDDAAAPTTGGTNGGGGETTDTNTTRQRRRCCTQPMDPAVAMTAVGRILAIFIVLGFVYLLFMSDLFSSLSRKLGSQMFDPDSVREHIQASVDTGRMRDIVQHFTSYAHVAGTEGDFAQAVDVKNMFQQYGLEDVSVDEYYVYLNYPKPGGRAVALLDEQGADVWTAKLEEDEAGDEAAGRQTAAFHGLSKAGTVQGPLVYANYGSREDLQKLADSGIRTEGAIALVRYYGTQADRGAKVKAAERAGFLGCLIYSDPQEDGFLHGDVAPEGRFMPADGVQRGSVALTSLVVGDVLTPGWESKKNMPRLSPDKSAALPQIPSLPLAWRDAQVLLQRLQGVGLPVPDDGWKGGVPEVGEVWWTGNVTAGAPVVRLQNEQDEVQEQPIWNVYGRIVGVEQAEKRVIIGNHRDAWTFGAADPHSGTAVMLEVARIFGDLVQRGWRPLRTIEFMSWDAEEYNLIGSTEYVEKNLDALRADALAYLNLDTAVTGPNLQAAGSPVFAGLLAQVMKRVNDPQTNSTSLFDSWRARQAVYRTLGAGSDYVAFQDMAGTSSLDLFFDGDVYPMHSSYETFDWMDRHGDPGFVYHGALAQVLGLMVIELADRPVLPLDLAEYSTALLQWVKELVQWVQSEAAAHMKGMKDKGGSSHSGRLDARHGHGNDAAGAVGVDLGPLQFAADYVALAISQFDRWELEWQGKVLASGGWEPSGLGSQRADYNSRMARFETDLLDLEVGGGIPNRTQYKHVLFAPQLWDGYEGDLFPAVRDAVLERNWSLANETVSKIARILQKAGGRLIE